MKNENPASKQRVPATECRAELTVVNSRFIAIAAPAFSVEEARNVIQRIRNEFPDATHHVPAYLIGYGSSTIEHCNDDGEPAGTAGKPILNVLKGSEIGNIVVVVVRYFGGTKLGTGGLVKAYQQAAKAVLADLPLATQVKACEIECQLSYSDYQKIARLVESYEGKELRVTFAELVTLQLQLPQSELANFERSVRDMTRGSAVIKVIRPEVFVLRPV